MGSAFEETLFDFDLGYLTQTTTNTVQELQARNEKLRRSVIFLKKKVLFSNSAVTRYRIARNQANEFRNNQVFSKEECKQHLIEIKNFIDKVSRLENEIRAAESREREKDETICELQNKIGGLQSHENQLKLLLKERKGTEDKVEKKKVCVKDRGKKGLVEKENETLRKENARIPSLEKEIENLRKENSKIAISEKDNDSHYKDISKIKILEQEIETLRKENAKILRLENDIESLRKENAKILKLEKEIDIYRKENAKFTKLGKENETLRKNNARIPILEKEIESLRIKNAKIENLERVNKALREENAKIPNKNQEIGTLLTHLTLAVNEKEKLLPKYNTRKYESLSDRNSSWSDNSEAENDIFEEVLSPTPSDTDIAKMSPIADKNIVLRESDNDNSNEVVSVDTGRGSSLAYSDNEKGLNSPDYFSNDSPLNRENIENKAKDVSMLRSTTLEDVAETATIPTIVLNDDQDICESGSTSTGKRHSKLSSKRSDNSTNVIREVSTSFDTFDYTSPNKCTQGVQEKQCLEFNNSLQCARHIDSELEKIFSTMRLNFNVVSPIPKTPTTEFSELSDDSKIIKCNVLGDKCYKLLGKLKEYSTFYTTEHFCKSNPNLKPLSNNYRNHVNTSNNIDKLIKCFETILQTTEILDEGFIVNRNSDLEISSQELWHDDNNLIMTNPSSIEMDSDSLQRKERHNRLTHISLPISQDDNPKELLYVDSHLASVSNQSSPVKDTDSTQDQQEEDRLSPMSFPMSPNENQNLMLNHSVSEELTIDIEISKDTDSVRCPANSEEINQLAIKNRGVKKPKNKKITKLEKLKKKLEPKYKIRRTTPPLVKSRLKPKQLSPIKKKVTVKDTSASLNDKCVYEKAVKIMAEINSQQSGKISKSPPKCTKELRTSLDKDIDSNDDNRISQNCSITTRSKRKHVEQLDQCTVESKKVPLTDTTGETKNFATNDAKQDNEISDESLVTSDEPILKKRRRRSSNEPEIQCKRVLRSSTVHLTERNDTEDKVELSNSNGQVNRISIEGPIAEEMITNETKLVVSDVHEHENTLQCQQLDQHDSNVISYGDLDVFSEDVQLEKEMIPVKEINTECTDSSSYHPKESILCCMIEKYGVETVRPYATKIPDLSVKLICEKIEQEITTISELPLNDTKNAMNRFVADLRKLNYKHFITAMMKYLMKPERKQELFGKVSSCNIPAMTKAEQILLYVITHLKTHWPSVDIVDAVLSNIEYILFKLNRTPEFDIIESTSHFYALLCRYFGAKSRLRLFILDAMYCIQFKAVPLIKQCLEVWMHIIPLAHMGIAKSPLVTCLVYLLHFYKCDDKFNRVQEIRNILSRKYFYKITDWNETKILEMFKNSIKDLKDISIEKKMLRLALIILAKRQGPRWCQNNIIKNLLQPLIEKENVPKTVKEFCVSMIGPLMKPYPVDMKVHCEIAINQLTEILNNNPSPEMEEAAITSMMFINRHNQHSINQTLLSRKMKPMSSELEKIIRDYVKARPLKIWKTNLSKIGR